MNHPANEGASSGRPSSDDEEDASNNQIVTVEEMSDNNDGPPLPPQFIQESTASEQDNDVSNDQIINTIEEMSDNNDGPPLPPPFHQEEGTSTEDIESKAATKKMKGSGMVEIVNDDGGPPMLDLDLVESQKKKAAIPTRSVVDDDQQNITTPIQHDREDVNVEQPTQESSLQESGDIELGAEPPEAEAENQSTSTEDHPIFIPEATLVGQGDGGDNNDDIVISGYAEPLLPWWKQRRTKVLFALVCIVIAGAAIAIGVSFSREPETNTVTKEVLREEPPTVFPSSSPTTSLMPSSAPTMCSSKIYSGIQKVSLPLTSHSRPRIGVDGGRMVVSTYEISTESTYVVFYSLDWVTGAWEVSNFIIEPVVSRSVAISGKSALAGFSSWDDASDKNVGSVHVYEENNLGYWEKKGELMPDSGDRTGYGRSVSIDDNLACVTSGSGGVAVYQRNTTSWRQIGTLGSGEKCLIEGNLIVVERPSNIGIYKVDQDSGKIVSPQVPLTSQKLIRGTALSARHLVFFEGSYHYNGWVPEYQFHPEEMLIYERPSTEQNFTLQQTLTPFGGGNGRLKFDTSFLESEDRFRNHLLVEDNILVVGGYSKEHAEMPDLSSAQTLFYTEIGGSWEEMLALDLIYSNYHMSGRQLVVDTNQLEIETFNIEECTLAVPTQMPSLSTFPTESIHPTGKPTYRLTASYTFPGAMWTRRPTQEPAPSFTLVTLPPNQSTTLPSSDLNDSPSNSEVSTIEPALPPEKTLVPCLTEEQCKQRSQQLAFTSFVSSMGFPTKGCFSKKTKAFFGMGGSIEEMSTPNEELVGVQERIMCES